ncbi:MAG TPA: DUF2059 domain-containing protein [Caldimonas sp.]|nr:DUF2059 domain-containing protein [Caldimonas sp.]
MTIPVRLCLMAAALALATTASAQSTAKKELVQKILQIQQSEIEGVARNVIERPALQMMQEAGLALQRQAAPDKREAMGKAIEVEVKKYIDEAYPLVRERALRIAPATIGAALEEKMTEDELKQIVAWLDSPVNRKYQQLGPDMRNAFIQKLLTESQPVVDPKLTALDGRIRVILGIPPAPAAGPAPARPAAPARAASR